MSDNVSGPPIGTVLGGKYRITKQIGRGGMATIFAAENVAIGKQVAVKVLSHELADSKTVTERFLREARAAAKIKSPYICEVYDLGTLENRPFIVMELLVGESLYDRLARERRMPLHDVDRVAAQVCKGLSKAHAQQIVHRDLKPENIFLTTSEDGQMLSKLLDFGLAKFYEQHQDANNARLTKEGALFGTPAYMSPEQARAKHNVDHRADLWALGCIVYEMLTGRTVWDVEQGVAMILAQVATGALPDPSRYRRDLPPSFGPWFHRALSRDVKTRFQSAEEFTASLSQALGFEPVVVSSYDRNSPPVATPTPVSLPTDREAQTERAGPPAADARVAAPRRARRYWPWASLFVLGAAALAFAWLGPLGAKDTLDPAETAPYAERLAEAQAELLDGHLERAYGGFQAAFQDGNAKAARSLLSHLEAAKEVPTGACKLNGIGHPRPFDASKESSKPSGIATSEGTLVVWASADNGEGRTTAYTALLDDALRRVSEPIDVTPAATLVREPELVRVGERVGLHYWDFAGEGVFTQMLDERGRATAGRRAIRGPAKSHPYYPSVVKSPRGGYAMVYVEPSRERIHDLYYQSLDDLLAPKGDPVPLTGYATPQNGKVQAARPSIAFHGDLLHVAFTLRRPASQELLLLRVPLSALRPENGVKPQLAKTPPTGGNEELDRFLGQVMQLNVGSGKFDLATIRCAAEGCYVAWDDTKEAAELAFVTPEGKVAWRRQLTDPATGTHGARPGILLRERGIVAAWYEADRVMVAPISQGAPITPTAVGRVFAVLQQPQPLLFADEGRVLVSWRGYEAAVPEPFIAAVSCP